VHNHISFKFEPYVLSHYLECCEDVEKYKAGLLYVMTKLCTYPAIDYIDINIGCNSPKELIGIVINTIMGCTHQPGIEVSFFNDIGLTDTIVDNSIIPMIKKTSNILSLSVDVSDLKESTIDSLVKTIYVDNYTINFLWLAHKRCIFTIEKLKMMKEWLHVRKKPIGMGFLGISDVSFDEFNNISEYLMDGYKNENKEHAIVKLDEIETILANSSIKILEIIN
jgi:hypothetical protein